MVANILEQSGISKLKQEAIDLKYNFYIPMKDD